MFAIVIALSAAACTEPSDTVQPIAGMSQTEFVTIMQELGTAEPGRRDSLLTRHGTSEAELRKYITALATDPLALSRTLDSLQVRMDRDRSATPEKGASPPPE